jgi:beta-aspartyl-peptidase (threonine type)
LPRPVIAIHGGAGTIDRSAMTASKEARYVAALRRALKTGYRILEAGGPGLDAVVAAVVELEDSPLFNAGRGAVFNADERHELDASVMDGTRLRAGAVAGVSRIKNPVLAARAVMEHSAHVLLAGRGAERFARRQGLTLVAKSYFSTAARLAALRTPRRTVAEQHGTVGAVARDSFGNLAAATSTGGYTGKLPGRIGDSPIIGAGTYADNRSCAVSGTGLGEVFIRCVLAYDVAARMRYCGEPLKRAASAALESISVLGGYGGLIAIDHRGNVAMPFNCEGMYRGCIDRGGRETIAIYR